MKPLLCLLLALAFALSIAVRAWMRRREREQQRARTLGELEAWEIQERTRLKRLHVLVELDSPRKRAS